uniref:Protein kinase domain-containing protein n=1 Tax=Heterorhabditis bacteriophora TaxID=37862 RepID=A0A1I7XB22_HETBA
MSILQGSLEIAQLGGISLILVELTNPKVPEKAVNDWIAMLTEFFEHFIDIGHYVQDLNAYKPLVMKYGKILSHTPLSELSSLWESVNQRREPLGRVGEFDLIELLGSGAFGCVYTVRKRVKEYNATPQYFALKEIFMVQLKNCDSDKSFGDIISEVKIIKQQLRHPNIVRYRRIFVENSRLYIVMDLIEGASLKMILALRYLHKDKQIIHRDLKPNNIMISEGDRVVITDFGLAKQKGNDYLNSAAGTIVYSCPEIVQNLPYGEKADVWSFGCCVYEMAALKPPFNSQNMLALVTQIVEGKYEPLGDNYSSELSILISNCLSTEPSCRPDVIGVSQIIAPRLLLCLDDIFRIHASNEKHTSDKPKNMVASANRASTSLESSSNSSAEFFMRKKSSIANESKRKLSKTFFPNIENNIDKPRRFSAKSFSAGQPYRHRSSVSLSSSLPRIAPIGQVQTRRVTLLNDKRASSSSSADIRLARSQEGLSVRSAALRPISDPVLQILDQIHKIVLISDSSKKHLLELQINTIAGSSESVNHKRRLVEQFKKRLFGKESNSDVIKKHLRKLAIESQDEIDLDLGYSDFRPVLANIHLSGYKLG